MDFAVAAAIRAVDKFSVVVNKMGGNMTRFGTSAEGAFARANKGAGIFKAVLGANLVTGVVRRVVREVGQLPQVFEAFASRGQEIGRTASIIGMSAEAFQRLSYAAKLTDTNVDTFTKGMELLNRGMGELRTGNGALALALRRQDPALGAQLRKVQDSKEAFLLVADAVSRTTNVQKRAAIVQAAFGRSSQDLIPMLALGRTGLHKLMEEASAYGTVLDDKVIAAAGRFDDSLKRLRGGLTSLKDRALSAIIPKLEPIVERMTEWVVANKDLIGTRLEGFVDGVARALEHAGPFLDTITKGFGWIVDHKTETLSALFALKAAFIGLSAALDANPIGAVVAALYLLAAAAVLVVKHWDQITGAVRSAWGWFDRLYEKSEILRHALFFLASPLWLIAETIRTIIDLISGKGWASLGNLIPPWAKGLLGIDASGYRPGETWDNAQAPNAGAPSMRVVNNINVDNTRAPGVNSAVRAQTAPYLAGYAGANP